MSFPVRLWIGLLVVVGLDFSLRFGYATLAAGWLDNPIYLALADGIRHSHLTNEFAGFLGLPALIAAASFVMPPLLALVCIGLLSSLITVAVLSRLYPEPAILALFAVSSYWYHVSLFGGSETLFCALLFASLLFARRESWAIAAVLAALSTTVRALGVFALLAYAIVLLRQRQWRALLTVTAIGAGIGAIYLGLTWLWAGDPFVTLRAYRRNDDWPHPIPIGLPFAQLVDTYRNTGFNGLAPRQTLSLTLHLLLTLVSACLLPSPSFLPLPDRLFAGLSMLFLVCYPYPDVLTQWPRFTLPLLPILLATWTSRVPRSRPLWATAALIRAAFISRGALF